MLRWVLILGMLGHLECSSLANAPPQIAMNDSGDAIVVWQGYDTSSNMPAIKYSEKALLGSWSTAAVLSNATKSSSYPDVAMNSSGQILVAWNEVQTTYSVQGISGSFQQPWNAIDTLLMPNSFNNIFPMIVMDSNGNGMVLWQNKTRATSELYTSTYTLSTNSWSSPFALSSSSRLINSFEISMNASGEASAIWSRLSGALTSIEIADYIQGEWTPPTAVILSRNVSGAPQIAINDLGDVIAVWQNLVDSHIVVETATRSIQGVWGPIQRLSGASYDSINPRVKINNNNKAVVVWERLTSTSTSSIESIIYDSGSWGEITTLSDSSAKYTTPAIALNNMDQAFVIWNNEGVIEAIDLSSQNIWGSPVVISAQNTTCIYPQIGIDNNQNAVGVWHSLLSGTSMIQAATYTGSWGAVATISD